MAFYGHIERHRPVRDLDAFRVHHKITNVRNEAHTGWRDPATTAASYMSEEKDVS